MYLSSGIKRVSLWLSGLNKEIAIGRSPPSDQKTEILIRTPLFFFFLCFDRHQPPPLVQSTDSQLSDMSDTFDTEPKVPEISYLEAVDGVQPELSKCPIQTKIKGK